MDKLTDLRALDFSQNEFGNEGVEIISEYSETSVAQQALRRIRLSQCHITSLPEKLVAMPLTHFDISFNKLTNDALSKMLLNLNEKCLEQLVLSYAFVAHKNAYGVELLANGLALKNFQKLRQLGLSGLDLTDGHFYTIISALTDKSIKLEVLEISNNSLLSTASLQHLCNKLPYLKKIIALRCRMLLCDTDSLQILQTWSNQLQFPEFMLLSLPKYAFEEGKNLSDKIIAIWRQHWNNERGKFLHIDDVLCLFTDERDCQAYFPI